MTWPDDFIWGTSSTSLGAEGPAPLADWSRLEGLGRVPHTEGNGFVQQFGDDFELFAGAGFGAHRLGIEWARIEPEPGRYDGGAIEQYQLLLTAARECGLQPWVCLHHASLPGWFADDEGGFRRDPSRGRYLWSRYVDVVADALGDLVGGWVPIDQPAWYAHEVGPRIWPAPDTTTTKRAELLETLHLANADAARLLRGGNGPVAMVQHLRLPYRVDDKDDTVAAAKAVDYRWWGSWNRPELLEPFDLVGFRYDHAVRIDEEGNHLPHPNGQPVGPLGFAPWVEGLGHVLRRLAEQQPLPILIADLRIATADEHWRVRYLREALAVVEEAVAEGIKVRGCFFPGIEEPRLLDDIDAPAALFDRNRRPRPATEEVVAPTVS